jgi:cobalt-zinc-cadmium efflux system protein
MHAHADGAHAHASSGVSSRRRLALALALVVAYMGAEIAGGLWTGSLALLADAAHMFSDAAALVLALAAAWVASLPATRRWTYGRVRAEILAALAQGVVLGCVAIGIALEAVGRMQAPPPVAGAGVLWIATGGLAVNALGLAILAPVRHGNLNLRGAFLHVLSDAIGSAGAMLAGFAIYARGWYWADPVASLAIAALVLFSGWQLLREAVDVLMEAAPGHLDVSEIERSLAELDRVAEVHDLHVWTIGGGEVSLSCHLQLAAEREHAPLLREAYQLLGQRFGIDHATIQIEPQGFAGESPRSVCGACAPEPRAALPLQRGAVAALRPASRPK